MSQRLAELRLAFMLLTRLPMGRLAAAPPLPAVLWAYPVVGAVVGGLAGLVFTVAAAHLPPGLAALLAIGALVLLTGGLHEDGLADFADSFGGRTRARRLEIMRDSRIGSYGVVALGLGLGLRAVALAALPPGHAVAVLAGLGAFSRALLPPVMLALPPARAEGLGHAAGQGVPARGVAWGLGLAGLLLLVLHALPWLALGGMAGVVALLALLARSRLGGFTGDVLGAMQLLAETAGLCLLAAH